MMHHKSGNCSSQAVVICHFQSRSEARRVSDLIDKLFHGCPSHVSPVQGPLILSVHGPHISLMQSAHLTII